MEILDYNLNDGDILSLDKNNVVYNININKNQNVKIIEHILGDSFHAITYEEISM